MNEVIAKLNDALTKCKALSLIGEPIPKHLNLSVNKLLCDYNQQLKAKDNGK